MNRLQNHTNMKFKGSCAFICLLLVSAVSAQVTDTARSTNKSLSTIKPKTQVEQMANKVKNLKITRQNLVDVKEAAAPTLNALGVPTDAKDVVVFVDGKEVPMETYKKMNPADIDSISILKNQDAIKKLTSKKCTMAILITTKKKTTAK